MKTVHLHIDRLVLHGVQPGERAAWQRSFEAALQQALAEPGAAERWAALGPQPRLRAVVAGAGGAAAGTALAGAATKPDGGTR